MQKMYLIIRKIIPYSDGQYNKDSNRCPCCIGIRRILYDHSSVIISTGFILRTRRPMIADVTAATTTMLTTVRAFQ